MLYRLLRPLLFALPPETAHALASGCGRALGASGLAGLLEGCTRFEDPRLEVEVLGTRFENPVGLAAGFDKNATLLGALRAAGFGYVEVGSVTARPHGGNTGERLVRLPERQAVWNRLGLPGDGCEAVAARLAAAKPVLPVGVNVAVTPLAPDLEKAEDLSRTLSLVGDHADYLTVNVSCPNVGEDPSRMARELLDDVEVALASFREGRGETPPVLLKLPPVLEGEALAALVERALGLDVAGFVLVNTLPEERPGVGVGGISGRPLRELARDRVREVRALAPGATLIGVGGVSDAESAYALIRAGADLLQLYTGLIYHGPMLVPTLLAGLCELLERDGFSTLREAVGADVPPARPADPPEAA